MSFAMTSPRVALSTSHRAGLLDPDAFQHHPIVVDRLTQLKAAYSLAPKSGLALEFGVFKGASLRALALHDKGRRFTGFDSFCGLPEEWRRSSTSVYQTGHFALEKLPLMPPNASLVRGFFHDTLTGWLAENGAPLAFLHVDGDLYSSAKYVLTALSDRIVDGTIIVFDELGDWKDEGVYPLWREGEWRALEEWIAETGYVFRILSRGERFEAAIQVFRNAPKPRSPADDFAYATQLWRLGAADQAIALLDETVGSHPGWVAGSHSLALWRTKLRQADDALATIAAIWDVAHALPDSNHAADLYRLRAENKLRLDDLAGASLDIAEFVKRRPANASGLALSAAIAGRRRDHAAAASAWADAYTLSGLDRYREKADAERALAEIRPEFLEMKSGRLIQHLIDDRDVATVLDVGSGAGKQAMALRRHGKVVTEVDYGESHYFAANEAGETIIRGDFMELHIAQKFDCVLASHVLEHQRNVNAFLRKLGSHLKEGGVLAISVPPLKHQIVGGHLTLWNAGLVLYNLVLAGFDCREPWIRQYGYNISVSVVKRTIEPTGLVYDKGDIGRNSQFLPKGCVEGFNGDIRRAG